MGTHSAQAPTSTRLAGALCLISWRPGPLEDEERTNRGMPTEAAQSKTAGTSCVPAMTAYLALTGKNGSLVGGDMQLGNQAAAREQSWCASPEPELPAEYKRPQPTEHDRLVGCLTAMLDVVRVPAPA